MAISLNNFTQDAQDRRKNQGVLSLDFAAETNDLTAHLKDVEIKVGRAVNRAVRKTAAWLRTHAMRELAQELNIKQAPLKRRFVVGSDPKSPGKAKIWVGLLAIAAHDLGKAKQNASGVSVAGRQFDGAFYRPVYGSEPQSYIRASRNRVMQHDVVRENRRRDYRSLRDPKLKGRFPLQVVGIAIQQPAEIILQRYEGRVNQRYREILDRELRYAIDIE